MNGATVTTRAPAGVRAPGDRSAAGRPGRTRVRVVVVGVLAAIWVFPLYWMLVTALSPPGSVTAGSSPLVPTSVSVEPLRVALERFPVLDWMINALAIAVVAVALTVVVDLLAGYALAKYRFPGRALVLLVVVGTLMVPIQVLLIPQFDLVSQLGWVNSYWAVIVPRAAEAFGVFVARQFFLSIPDELLEAAALDGAGPVRTFVRVVLPLSRPLVAVLVVITFMYRWNEFAWPLVALRDPALYTLPIGLAFLQGQYSTDYPTLMGAALISTLPVLLLFALCQRQFVQGLARSGIK